MRRAGAWKQAITQRSFWIGLILRLLAPAIPIACIAKGAEWSGGEAAGVYCTEDLGEYLVGNGLLLLAITLIGYFFEFAVRIMRWYKASFIFVPLILIMGAVHVGIWSYGWVLWKRSAPGMDYTWTFTSEDEQAHMNEEERVWGSRTLAPTPAPAYDGYGCQEELLVDYFILQAVGK